uniref:Synaptotagmin XIb n=1 Tax=Eptatretus burgeri TaxID=7764 RepID=A0A8C4N535_EPTBU
MPEVTFSKSGFEASPIVLGMVGAALLAITGAVSTALWFCCQRRAAKVAGQPPYRFIHMLKGISIYPEALQEKRTFRGRRVSVPNKKPLHLSPPDPSDGGSIRTPAAIENTLLAEAPLEPGRGTSRGSPDGGGMSRGGGGKTLLVKPVSPSELVPGVGSTSSSSSELEELQLGKLLFSVEYNFSKKALVVNIEEARGLPIVDERTASADPYIKMTILPEKKHKVKTRVLRRTLDPTFDETFTFYGIPLGQLQGLVLHFLVLSFDRFSRDDVIGEVMVSLVGLDLSNGERVSLSRDIIKRNIQKVVGRGELLLSLSYQPAANRLSAVILKARHLPKADIVALSDPYVKLKLYIGRRRVAKKKTHVKRGTLSPVYNESFAFDLTPDTLPDASLELHIINFDRTTKSEGIGRLLLGPAAPGSGGEHWREVIEHPRRQVAKWHSLSDY